MSKTGRQGRELRLLPARRVPLTSDERREAVALLAGLLLEVAASRQSLAKSGTALRVPRSREYARDAA